MVLVSTKLLLKTITPLINGIQAAPGETVPLVSKKKP